MRIILKSASPRRKELMELAGYSFIVDPADVDEDLDINKTPYENVKELGLKKALWNREKYPEDILIGCDTIVVYDGVIYGKPKDELDAFNTLKKLSGTYHEVMSGVGIVYKDVVYNFVSVSTVYFKNLTDEQIWEYVKSNECFGKAGSYAIQGLGGNLVDHYEGSLDNIIGIPMEEVKEKLGDIFEMVH